MFEVFEIAILHFEDSKIFVKIQKINRFRQNINFKF